MLAEALRKVKIYPIGRSGAIAATMQIERDYFIMQGWLSDL
jgi:hypothetical protein